jgi:hypothetical protein
MEVAPTTATRIPTSEPAYGRAGLCSRRRQDLHFYTRTEAQKDREPSALRIEFLNAPFVIVIIPPMR